MGAFSSLFSSKPSSNEINSLKHNIRMENSLSSVSVNKNETFPISTTGNFIAAAIAACFAVTFTNPWECIKTRLQLQGELSSINSEVPKPYKNAFSAFNIIWKTEGFEGIQKGLRVAYVYQILMNGTRLGAYNWIKESTSNTLDKIYGKQDSPRMIVLPISGGLCGVLGAVLSSPLYLIKTRMQSYTKVSSKAVGYQHSYVEKGILYSLKHIYSTDGIRGLWKGVDASMLRTSIGSAVQLSTYDSGKMALINSGFFKDDNMSLYFASSLLTSFFVVIAMNPFDVATTRMYNQRSNVENPYSNVFECMYRTARHEGIKALYKGMGAHYLRMGPHTILTLMMYEQMVQIISKTEVKLNIPH